MDSKQLGLLDDLENSIQKFVSDFEKALPGSNQEIADELISFLGKLKQSKSGNLIQSVDNLKLIDRYRKTLDKAIYESNYTDSATKFIENFKSTTGYVNDYFATLVSTFETKELYGAILQANVDNAASVLLGSGIDANFKDPIIKILKDQVVTGSNTKAARQTLRDFIQGNPDKEIAGKLNRYVNQVANDSVRQFTRSYTKAVTDDLGLKHYFFKGTKINDSRSFCKARVGKYFTEAEVKSWSKLDWSGKNPSTTADTIFLLVGGWNCKHSLVPVSKLLFDKFRDK